MYFLWKNKPRSVLGHALNWIPASEIQKRLDEVGCFTSAEEARMYMQTNFPRSGVSVLNRKVFQQKVKTRKTPQFKPIAYTMPEKGPAPEDGHLVYADYLDRLVGDAVPGANTVVFPPANIEKTSRTELISNVRLLLETVQRGLESLDEQEDDLRDKIRQLDLATSDRLHQAELHELDDEACKAYVATLKENLILRRRYKNELQAVQAAKDVLKSVSEADTKAGLQQIEDLGSQSYHCRVLTQKDNIVKMTAKS